MTIEKTVLSEIKKWSVFKSSLLIIKMFYNFIIIKFLQEIMMIKKSLLLDCII